MGITQKTEFTESDKQLLNKIIPHDPCTTCSLRISVDDVFESCCGCSEETEYQRKVKPYKDAGIFEIACALRKIYTLRHTIESAKIEIQNIISVIPEEIRNDVLSN